jgi:hypothetical protein
MGVDNYVPAEVDAADEDEAAERAWASLAPLFRAPGSVTVDEVDNYVPAEAEQATEQAAERAWASLGGAAWVGLPRQAQEAWVSACSAVRLYR